MASPYGTLLVSLLLDAWLWDNLGLGLYNYRCGGGRAN